MIHRAGVSEASRDCPRRIDAEGKGSDGTRNVERDDGAVALTQKAMLSEICVQEISRDCPRRVDAQRSGRAVTRSVERDEPSLRDHV